MGAWVVREFFAEMVRLRKNLERCWNLELGKSGSERNSRMSDKLSKREHESLWKIHGIMGQTVETRVMVVCGKLS